MVGPFSCPERPRTAALAAALADLGYAVTGMDRNADAVAAAGERGVPVIHADVRDLSGEYDIVLFTRSLHHADDLDGILAHAATLLAPGGQIVIEEFAWERMDHRRRLPLRHPRAPGHRRRPRRRAR